MNHGKFIFQHWRRLGTYLLYLPTHVIATASRSEYCFQKREFACFVFYFIVAGFALDNEVDEKGILL